MVTLVRTELYQDSVGRLASAGQAAAVYWVCSQQGHLGRGRHSQQVLPPWLAVETGGQLL